MKHMLENARVRASVYSFGGMVLMEFNLNGRWVQPMFLPAWAADTPHEGFLDNLRGDFPCVPFGGAPETAFRWPGWHPDRSVSDPDGYVHGFSSNHTWNLVEKNVDSLTLEIAYPETHPIERLERRVVLDPMAMRVCFIDCIYPRRNCKLPIGLHPIFSLPKENRTVQLDLPGCIEARTYPGKVDETSVFAADTAISDYTHVPLQLGGSVDVTRLPMEWDTEELLMLCGVKRGRVSLIRRNYSTVLEWDTACLPSCLLWFSNRGRRFEPWNGQNLCIGVEPVRSAFDQGTAVSLGDSPIPVSTFMTFEAGKCVSIAHSISVEGLPGESENANEMKKESLL